MKTRAILSQLPTSWGYFIWDASMVQRRSVCSTRAVVEVLECLITPTVLGLLLNSRMHEPRMRRGPSKIKGEA